MTSGAFKFMNISSSIHLNKNHSDTSHQPEDLDSVFSYLARQKSARASIRE